MKLLRAIAAHKVIGALFTALVMLLALAGCNSSTSSNPSGQPTSGQPGQATPRPGPDPIPDPLSGNYTFHGWGVSLAWWAEIMGGWPAADQAPIIHALFDSPSESVMLGGTQVPALGLTILRYNLGASPCSPSGCGAVNGVLPQQQTVDCPATGTLGTSDFNPHIFRLGANVPTLQQAKGGTPSLSADPNQINVLQEADAAISGDDETPVIQAFANSPPYWLLAKGNGCPQGNGQTSNVLESPVASSEAAYADYLAAEVAALRKGGINVSTVEPFNEPSHAGGWGSCPAVTTTDPFPCEHNLFQEGANFDPDAAQAILTDLCSVLPRGVTAAEPDGENPGYTDDYLNQTPPSCVSQIDTHSYATNDQGNLVDAVQALGKPLWMSEYGNNVAMNVADIIGENLNELTPATWVYWTAMEGTGPGSWGLLADPNMTTSAADPGVQNVQATPRYYALAQFSEFIRPGNTIYPFAGGSQNGVVVSRNPDNHKVTVVAVNDCNCSNPLIVKLYPGQILVGNPSNATVTAVRTDQIGTDTREQQQANGAPNQGSDDLTLLPDTTQHPAENISVFSDGTLEDTAPAPDSITTYVITPNPPNPSHAAIAAWKATANDASNIVGAALTGVTTLLPSAEDATQIAELNQLATIPLADLDEDSALQVAQGTHDIQMLDTFFGTPGLMPGEGSNTGTPTPPPTTPPPTTPPPTLVTPGNESPADAVDGFYQSELAGDWAAVCSYVTPSAQSLCLAGTSGQAAATGNATVGTMVLSADGNEALVSVTGSICAPSTPCVSNSDASLGMPSSPSQFLADYQTAVANSTSDSSTSISPMPCSQINGKWYVDFG